MSMFLTSYPEYSIPCNIKNNFFMQIYITYFINVMNKAAQKNAVILCMEIFGLLC